MSKALPTIEVLIVSLCLAQRRDVILRAIESVVSQKGVVATPVIVVNGDRFDPELFAELKQRPDVRVLYQQEASIFLARRLARENVTAPFFAMLDDDDELLPNGLRLRVELLLRDPSADVVTSNGYFVSGSEKRLKLEDIQGLRLDPLDRLIEGNWLPTASGLYRTKTITPDYFDVSIKSNDMTYLAFRLALERRVLFLDTPTYRKIYSPDSISLTDRWSLPAAWTLRKMLGFRMPNRIRHRLRQKYGRAMHFASDYYLREGELGKSWSCHLRSLLQPGGLLEFGLYTRKLIALSAKNLLGWSRARGTMKSPKHGDNLGEHVG